MSFCTYDEMEIDGPEYKIEVQNLNGIQTKRAPSRFLLSPPEIRNKIYTYVFDSASILGSSALNYDDMHSRTSIRSNGHQLLRVCRQIRAEARAYQGRYTHLLLFNCNLQTLIDWHREHEVSRAKLCSLTFGLRMSSWVTRSLIFGIEWGAQLRGLEFASLRWVYLDCEVQEGVAEFVRHAFGNTELEVKFLG